MAYEEPIYPRQTSFSKGEVSPDIYGRVDLGAYQAGLATSRNAFIKTEGTWANRQGTQFCAGSLSQTSRGTILIPFTFNVGQSYVIEVGTGTSGIQVFSQGTPLYQAGTLVITSIANVIVAYNQSLPVYQIQITTSIAHGLGVGQNVSMSGITGSASCTIINGSYTVSTVVSPTVFATNAPNLGGTFTYSGGGTVGVLLTAASPYLLSELPFLRYSQSADTLTIVHPKHPPYEFKRTSASTFTFQPGVYSNGPFIQQNTDGTTLVYASATGGTVTLTASAPIFNANHVGGLFQLTQQDFSVINPWVGDVSIIGNGANPVGQYCYSNGKNYKAVAVPTTGGQTAWYSGPNAPSHSFGTQWDGNQSTIQGTNVTSSGIAWQFQDFGYGVVLITGFVSATQVTGIVQAVETNQPALLPISVVGPRTVSAGPLNFVGNGTQTSFGPISGGSTQDPNKYFVTINGLYVVPGNYVITGAGGNIVLAQPPASGAQVSVSQVNGLYATSFWAFGAFSPAQGYPSTCTYFPDRLIFAGTTLQPVGVFGSQTSNYHNFAVSSPVVASDAFTIFLNARQLNSISDLVPLQDLIVGTANIVWRLWPGSTGTTLSPLAIDATPQGFVGEATTCAAVLFADSMIYAIYGGRRIRDLQYQFAFDKYMGQELTAYSRHLIPFGTYATKMQYAPDPWGQLYVLRSDGILLCCTYVREQQMVAWNRWDTGVNAVTGAGNGTFEDIALVPENNSYALYMIVNRPNGRFIERLGQWEWLTEYDYKFVDSYLTYDGRNTSTTTMTVSGGTTWLSGDVGTLTASSVTGWAGFQASDVGYGNAIQLFDAGGNLARVLITAVNSTVSAAVRFIDPIPTDLQTLPTVTWTFARTYFGGAQQLAGQLVSVLADSNALMGTNGAPYLMVDSGGNLTLPNPCGVVTVGLQYFSDFETLQLNQPGVETIRERAKSVPALYLDVFNTRGLLAGTDFVNLSPIKERAYEPYLDPTALQQGIINSRLYSEFDSECHICVRQPYPLPVTIRMVIPSVNVGDPIG